MVVAAASAGLALLVLAVFAVTMRERLSEAWYVWRLEAGDQAEKDRAAEALAAMGSPRVAGYLYEKVRPQLESRLTFGAQKPLPLNDFVRILRSITNVEVSVDPSVDPSTIAFQSILARDRPVLNLLQELLKETGLGYRIQAGSIVLCPRGKTRDTFTTLPPVVDGGQ